jgi:hypothetical protein
MEGGEVKQVQTITERMNHHRRRGKSYAAKAHELLQSKQQVAAFLKWDDAAMYLYKSSISYRICGKWREGAETLKRCAEMHEKLKLYAEAATLYTEVGEVFMKVDKGEALTMMRKAISIYCDAGKFDIAGRMERKIADLHFLNKHWEEASFHYKKAANFLSGEQMLDQSDACLEQAALCKMEIRELEDARELWELIATGCVQSNLRRFHARDKLFMGVLCMIGRVWKYPVHEVGDLEENSVEAIIDRISLLKYKEILELIDSYKQYDYLWPCTKEVVFFKNIINFRLDFDEHNLVDHVYFWNNVRPLTRFQLTFLKVMIDEVTIEMARRSELRRLEEMRKQLAVERKQKRDEMKAKFLELGIVDGYTPEMMEADLAEDEKKVTDSATQVTLMWGSHGTKRRTKKKKINADGELEDLSESGSAKISISQSEKIGQAGGTEDQEDYGPEKGGGGNRNDNDNELAFADDDDEEEEEEAAAERDEEEGEAKKERKKRVKKT